MKSTAQQSSTTWPCLQPRRSSAWPHTSSILIHCDTVKCTRISLVPRETKRQVDFDFDQTYLPELFARILSSDSLEDLGSTRMFIDKVGDIVNCAVYDKVHLFRLLVVLGHIGRSKCLGHVERLWFYGWIVTGKWPIDAVRHQTDVG